MTDLNTMMPFVVARDTRHLLDIRRASQERRRMYPAANYNFRIVCSYNFYDVQCGIMRQYVGFTLDLTNAGLGIRRRLELEFEVSSDPLSGYQLFMGKILDRIDANVIDPSALAGAEGKLVLAHETVGYHTYLVVSKFISVYISRENYADSFINWTRASGDDDRFTVLLTQAARAFNSNEAEGWLAEEDAGSEVLAV